ncbi:MAG: thiol reductant ABC exporter subunit CydD, partial [Azospirillaceae bacterium]
ARGARATLALAIGAGLADGALVVAQAALIAWILHGAIAAGLDRGALTGAFLALLAVFAARAAAAYVAEVAGFEAAARLRRELRDAVIDRLARLGPAFTTQGRAGALTALAVEQIEVLESYYARYLPQAALAVAIPLALLVVAFALDATVGAILAIAGPLIPVGMAVVGIGAAGASRRQIKSLGRLSGHFLDRLQGLTTLKLFGQARRELALVERVSDELRRRTLAVLRLAFLSSAVLELFASLAMAAVALHLAATVILPALPGGEAAASGPGLFVGLFLLLLVPEYFGPLRRLAAFYHDRASAIGAAEEILGLLEAEPPGPAAPAEPKPIPAPGRAALAFEGVTVAFDDGRRPAVEAIDLEIPAGSRVALVGPSGSGKTTLIGLAAGFVAPTAGRVRLNGVASDEADPEDWRARIAWIGQTPHLFHGTIADNIRLGRPDADAAAVARAAADARVAEFAEALPDGLDTPIGERGFGLSGGQAQRVALARAFLKDAPLVLLDEPTANLDAGNEAAVLEALDRLVAGRTVILATHGPLAGRGADRIVRLHEGRAATIDAPPSSGGAPTGGAPA